MKTRKIVSYALVLLLSLINIPIQAQGDVVTKSERGGKVVEVLFHNTTSIPADVYWLDFQGAEKFQFTLAPHAPEVVIKSQFKYAWRVKLGHRTYTRVIDKNVQPFIISISLRSPLPGGSKVNAAFVNTTDMPVDVFRVGADSTDQLKGRVAAGERFDVSGDARVGDIWIVKPPGRKDGFDWYTITDQSEQTHNIKVPSRLATNRVSMPPPNTFVAAVVAPPVTTATPPAAPKPVVSVVSRVPEPVAPAAPAFTEVFYGRKSTLGRGFNMFADTKSEETTLPLVLFDLKSEQRQIYGQLTEVPNNVNYNPQPETEFSSDFTASYSASEAQNTLQTSLGISGEYRGVSASVEATYGTESVRQTSTSFVEYKVRIRPAVLSFRPGGERNLAPDFRQALEQFRDANAARDPRVQDRFFRTYGTHYVSRVTLGAACTMVARVSHESNLDKEEIGVAAKASFDAKVVSGGVQTDTKVGTLRKRFEENSRVTFTAAGGDANIIVTGGQNGRINAKAYSSWVDSTRKPLNLSDIERRMAPIWELTRDPAIQANLKAAFDAYGKKKGKELARGDFTKRILGYEVEISLERIQCVDDNDPGVDPGDLFWFIWLDRPDEFNPARTTRVAFTDVGRANSISIASGSAFQFRDLVTDKNSLTQTFKVKPGAEFAFGGRVADADSTSADDQFGEFTARAQAPLTGPGSPMEMPIRLNAMGDVTLVFRIKFIPIQ